MSEPKPKSFDISKRAVWEAWLRVKANKGAAGVDERSIEEFEADLKGNLDKLWNRLASGSYMPPPVRAVEIPKRDGSARVLGVPTVADRVAQTVVRGYLEPGVEPFFHADSYGYRPRACVAARPRLPVSAGGDHEHPARRLGRAARAAPATRSSPRWRWRRPPGRASHTL